VASPVTSEALAAHSAEFRKDIVEVVPGIHVAIGYALANVILIEGDDGVIIVDTTESLAAARAIKAEFDRITDKPVAAIIYTHNHTDHIFGAAAFAQGRDVPVYAHATTWSHIERILNVLRPVIETRSFRMFGNYLAAGGESIVNDGIGPALAHTPGVDTDLFGLLQPTHTFEDRLEVTIAGRRLVLLHAPGETDDQILVWLPEEKVLLPGDNVYKAFPNLYTIRGTRYRDVMQWAQSVRSMRDLGAEHLIPSHTRPVSGAEAVDDIGDVAVGEFAGAHRFGLFQHVRVKPVVVVGIGPLPPLSSVASAAKHHAEWLGHKEEVGLALAILVGQDAFQVPGKGHKQEKAPEERG
jgi:alkyl sulfatase BDS1-like metallo-beta-lactamase superfamily hydrolase